MIKMIKQLFLFIVFVFVTSLSIHAQNNQNFDKTEDIDTVALRKREAFLKKEIERRNRKLENEKNKEAQVTENDVVYIFGVGTNFNDSTVYMTEVTPMPYMRIDKKTKFLPYRAEFSLQFKEYLEGKLGLVYETTCIFFSADRKKASKYSFKLRKRYIEDGYSNIIVVDPQKFSFKLPEYALPKQNAE